ncbi:MULTISPECIES: NACHT domain-containing protein [unclassified Arcicella]|uniref:NACHT domain-containing protein n=1 Tax=unclassified Arcicella TaxID=2644986 RepID=UPI002860AB42|nr:MULTISPECIES: NACHT domain-containing protein [unclassified Arcicella]MDR6564261.1 hypothetical protein [Arcicella sp. BE51]MDR6811492.1 hypothetical protein [Arcicella sp. BE140]MDR6826032.1 hypothetical protein [Arcicella sp. BE139]
MSNLVDIDKNNLSTFLENFVDTGVKAVDELDLFKDDGLVASVPYGKLIGYFAKKMIAISDPNKALKKLIASSQTICLFEGIKKYNLSLKIDTDTFSLKIKEIKAQLDEYIVVADSFDIENFFSNDIVKFYSSKLDDVFESSFKEIEKVKIRNFRDDYLQVYFYKILENQQTVFEVLNTLFKSKSYDYSIKSNRKESYKKELKNHFNDIVLNDENGMTLSDVYVEPTFRIHNYCLKEVDRDISSSFSEVYHNSIHDFVHESLENKLGESFICDSPNLFFVLGYPGQGKSSFCKKFLFDVYSNKPINKDVHFIKFRNITNSTDLINNPLQTLYEYWNENNSELKFDKNEFKGSVLVLDGLDELFMKDRLTQDAIDEFCRILIHELDNPKSPKVVITSRYGYVNLEKLKKTKTLILRLEEFDLDRQSEWLKKYKVFHPETNMTYDKLVQYNEDEKFASIKELITQPILLHMIVTLNQEVTTNMNRAIIYNNIFDSLINRKWAEEGQIEILKGLEKDDLRAFLRDIAFAIYISGHEYIHKSKLEKLPATISFIDKLQNKDRIKDVLKNIMVAFYFQETKKDINDVEDSDKNDYAIEFLHKSLQEYLVAEKIWDELLKFTDTIPRTNSFYVDNAKDGLILLHKIFYRKRMSDEIQDALSEIISQKDILDREKLSSRFKKFLPDWFTNGFVLNYSWGDVEPSFTETLMFENLWFVMSQLVPQTDYLGKITPDNFGFFSEKSFNMNWSNQTLSGLENGRYGNYNFLEIYRLYIESSSYSNEITNLKLNKLLLFQPEISTNKKDEIIISNCQIDEGEIYFKSSKVDIKNCIFIDCTMFINDGNFNKVKFSDCIIYILEEGEKSINVTDCLFIECYFKVSTSFDTSVFNDKQTYQNCTFIIRKKYEDGFLHDFLDNPMIDRTI